MDSPVKLDLPNLPSWPLAVATGLLVMLLTFYFYRDYKAYIALGPGGTPQTIAGYLKVKILSLLALRNACYTTPQPVQAGWLCHLQDRGPRPLVKGIAPHRQITQRASKGLYEDLNTEVKRLVSTTEDLKIDMSILEKHNAALFTTRPTIRPQRREICHVHPLDGSMHIILHPADINAIIEARWGERHPLARGGLFEAWVPEDFVMLYSPRSARDVEILIRIVRASIWYVHGSKKSIDNETTFDMVKPLSAE